VKQFWQVWTTFYYKSHSKISYDGLKGWLSFWLYRVRPSWQFSLKINCLHNWIIMQIETKLFSFDS